MKYFIVLMCWIAMVILPARASCIEITPFIGYGIGGQFEEIETETTLELDESPLYGLTLDLDAPQGGHYELFFSHQETTLTNGSFDTDSILFDMDISYLHIGGSMAYGYGWVKPFIVGTLGITHFNPSPSEYGSKTRFSFSLGGGLKFFLNDNIAIRFEARGFGTLFNSTMWFVSNTDGAQLGITGDAVWQAQLNVGLTLAF